MARSLSFLRPYLDARCRSLSLKASTAHLRFYSTCPKENLSNPQLFNAEWRRQLLNGEREPPQGLYPRCPKDDRLATKSWLLKHFNHLSPDTPASDLEVAIYGISFESKGSSHRSYFQEE